jgi:hypothetical protein
MTGPFRALPILLQLCDAIDALFIEHVGPFGQMITAEARSRWLAAGHKMKTSDVDDYMVLLAQEIEDREQRAEFVLQARQLVGVR